LSEATAKIQKILAIFNTLQDLLIYVRGHQTQVQQ
jgi:hypothetical protein